jgi:hypothetical protein
MVPCAPYGCKHIEQEVPLAPVRLPAYDAAFSPLMEGAVNDAERNIEALLSENRVFEPPPSFVQRAIVSNPSIYDKAEADHEAFWAEQAERLTWFRRWDTVMDWTPPWVKWFVGGTSRRVAATRSRTSGRASRVRRERSPTAICTRRRVGSRMLFGRSGLRREIGSRSTSG